MNEDTPQVDQTQTPSSKPTVVESQPKPPTKRHRLIVLILVLVILLAGAVSIYFLTRSDKQPSQETSTKQDVGDPSKEVLAQIKLALDKEYPNISTKEQDTIGVAIKLSNYDYYALTEDGATLVFPGDSAVSDTEFRDTDPAVDLVAAKLTDLGFTKVEEPIERTVPLLVNTTGTVYCTNGEKGSSPIFITCGTKASAEADAEKLREFVTAFRKSSDTSSYDEYTVLSLGEIKDSRTPGYKLMSGGVGNVVGIGGAAALFYQTPDKTWHFFTATQSVLSCSDYNTNDLRKAYAGEQCFNQTSESAVKP